MIIIILYGLVKKMFLLLPFIPIISMLDIKLYRQIMCIPMGTNCAPLAADMFLFCFEGDDFSDFRIAFLHPKFPVKRGANSLLLE